MIVSRAQIRTYRYDPNYNARTRRGSISKLSISAEKYTYRAAELQYAAREPRDIMNLANFRYSAASKGRGRL